MTYVSIPKFLIDPILRYIRGLVTFKLKGTRWLNLIHTVKSEITDARTLQASNGSGTISHYVPLVSGENYIYIAEEDILIIM